MYEIIYEDETQRRVLMFKGGVGDRTQAELSDGVGMITEGVGGDRRDSEEGDDRIGSANVCEAKDGVTDKEDEQDTNVEAGRRE